MDIHSPAFAEGRFIPGKFTCEGQEVSPKLEWSGVPEDAVELMLIIEDPDAPGGVFTHWVLSGLDPASRGVEEGEVPVGAVQGINDFGGLGYAGPCPPVGHGAHRYFFNLYALSAPSGLSEGVTGEAAHNAISGSVLREARCMGRYERRA